MANIGTRLLEMSFGRPSGPLGRIGGRLMARGNAATERHLVEIADLGRQDAVLILGPGPGVGLEAAGARSGHVIGIDPSELMLESCRRRSAELIGSGTVRLARGVAADTGQPAGSVDVVLAVNNVQIWPDWRAAFGELHRVLRPGGRVLVSAHEKWLPGGLAALAAAVERAGFEEIRTWTWEPPGRSATTAAQLRARRAVTAETTS
ncbi:MAG: methyltransferase domain-containing protein [Pseudonocardiaceae bacterium]|nr:methyltransferase domain-containing protein [Pseudonocardiaceae bacterium]